MRDLDDSDLKEFKKAELIKRYLELQEQCNTLKRSNSGFKCGNVRLSKELKYARKMWEQWRNRYVELKNTGLPESIRRL
mgnify:CR=1 FL=1